MLLFLVWFNNSGWFQIYVVTHALTLAAHSYVLLSQSSSKKKKEQERSMALIEKLQEERQRQEDNHRLVMARLRQEKDTWFSASKSTSSHRMWDSLCVVRGQ